MKVLGVILLTVWLMSCADEELDKNDISGGVANADLMMEFNGNQVFEGTGLTLKKLIDS